jgi:hypothetical protein
LNLHGGNGMMELDKWDVAILAVAAFVAVTALVRLMLARRDEVLREIQEQIDATRAKKKAKK